MDGIEVFYFFFQFLKLTYNLKSLTSIKTGDFLVTSSLVENFLKNLLL